MTKAEIIAELRRSVVEDALAYDVSFEAFGEVLHMRRYGKEMIIDAEDAHWRTFYLFVAHALEDE